jgi:hypothetical protein
MARWPAMAVAPYEFEAFGTVPPSLTADALPSDLEEVLSHARSLGAYLIRFDASDDTTNSLPTYDW